ncbi:MAG: hypothetical protein ACYSUQ_04670 [Planctomycetota bacterium]
MAKASLRRFDVQAKWSLWLSLMSVLPCLVMVALLVRNWESDINQIMFGNPLFQPLYLALTASAMLLSTFGLALGFNSAGQRRNELQTRSWLGFFVGAGVLATAFVLFAAFWMLRYKTQSG